MFISNLKLVVAAALVAAAGTQAFVQGKRAGIASVKSNEKMLAGECSRKNEVIASQRAALDEVSDDLAETRIELADTRGRLAHAQAACNTAIGKLSAKAKAAYLKATKTSVSVAAQAAVANATQAPVHHIS